MGLIKKLLFPLFLLIEATLFFVILFAPLSFLAGNILRFSTVGIATIFGWIFLDQKPYFVICAALTFTCIADFLLEIVDPPERSAATTCFLLAQFVYAGYICSFAYNTAETVVHLSVRGLLTIAAGIIVFKVLKDKADYLSLVSVVYFANLLLNIIFSFIHFKDHPLLAIGFLCFALCDLNVGLSVGVSAGYIDIRGPLYDFLFLSRFDFIWLFYIPSQTLLSSEIYVQQKKNRASI
ncbi:MAG: hypothetical protein VZR55_05415 [Candidatus Enteromonas sp.]|nr:hypothetical protein [Candidatus Enteromonas sp.]